ncbi:hypothetical protein H8N03_04880 [Ramlibacter sp. USB13]|uniref:Lipoprotein n=1 Tax=Ramlibacter cellulosilyticus TaxID=2764187 RepID=A0A923MP46_9BURK|nr:hypothetical protein [Ramlibacter cellulosilyticus]MBC5782268.1 hypothetical protein [Ramlibacter cellulosilyticus]
MKKALALCLVAAALTGCGSVNSVLADRHETVEMYHVFDVKTKATPDQMIKAATEGLARNTNSVTHNRPLQMGNKIPAEPGRFQLVDMADAFKGSGMGAILAMSGNVPLRGAKCDGAVWNAKANRDIAGSDHLTLYTCLYRYRDGYQLNMFAVFRKTSGGFTQIAREAAQAMVGTPEQWTTKTIIDTVRAVEERAGTKAVYVEGQPELGELPKVDALTSR